MVQNVSSFSNEVGGLLVPVVKNNLSRPEPEFRKASKVVSLQFTTGHFNDPFHIQKYNQYFESEHTGYELEEVARLF